MGSKQPSPITVAKEAAQAAVRELINADKMRLAQLQKNLKGADEEWSAACDVRNGLKREIEVLEASIAEREELTGKVGGVKVTPRQPTTGCVL